jgi:hypothetical protein
MPMSKRLVLVMLFNICLMAGLVCPATASELVPTSNFTEMPGAVWQSDPGFPRLRPMTIGGAVLTYNRSNAMVYFATINIPDPDNPNLGIGIGFYHHPTNPAPKAPVIIDFDVPISGFGATFMHAPDPLVFSGDLRPPARIEVYSLPGGQGTLLGSVDSSGFFGPSISKIIDFVGLYGYERVIRSARLSGLGEDEYFAVQGYAVSLVQDIDPPIIHEATAAPSVLWPPNNELHPVQLAVNATDAHGPVDCRIVSVTANAPISPDDWTIVGDLSLLLRARRSDNPDDRVYSVLVECSDRLGNQSRSTVTVTVPHDQRSKSKPPP